MNFGYSQIDLKAEILLRPEFFNWISSEAEEVLVQHDWPGNVRELQNAVEHAVMMGSTEMILPADLPRFVEPEALAFEASLARFKRSIVLEAFELSRGQIYVAADLLCLNRNYVYSLLKKLELTYLRRYGEHH